MDGLVQQQDKIAAARNLSLFVRQYPTVVTTTTPVTSIIGRGASSEVLAFYALPNCDMNKQPHRTIVYVDGFNFYYGALKGSDYKWLDLEQFFQNVMGETNEVIKVKYFTAKVSPNKSDPEVHHRQEAYLRALKKQCSKVETILGHFLRNKVKAEHAKPPPDFVQVWKKEEKGSDVNLAVHLLNDAWKNEYDCAVVVSNDSDLAESMKLAKQHDKIIGLITPGAPVRKTSSQLRQQADFVKPIRKWMLKVS